ncbi:O-antigen polysaccharide polymerase Wzy family protein [uncultured Merdimonas sp.]|uniref:O-antigen polysaccharide polymerase Wzy family protein n=1 Tax=uncultured Merdimonas sp. TaxID=2023269 RepID=UPI0032088F3D
MVNINKKTIYFDLGISIVFVLQGLFFLLQDSTLLYMGTFISWFLILLYSIDGQGKRASLLCFEITYFVFLLGGTFFSYLIESQPLFIFNNDTLLHTYCLLYLSQLILYIGYRWSEMKHKEPVMKFIEDSNDKTNINIRYYALIIMLISTIPALSVSINNIRYVSATSYENLYLRADNNLPFVINKLEQIFPIAFFLFLSTKPSKKSVIFPTLLYLGVQSTTLATGRRTDFVLSLMVVFFYFLIRNFITPKEKWIGKKELLAIAIGVPVLILLLVYVSNIRSGDSTGFSLGSGIIKFFRDQGVSITVIEYGKELMDQIPKQWYAFGTIIDFFKYNEITQLFCDFSSYAPQSVEQALYGNSYGDTISYLVIPYNYSQGFGLGSCYIAEMFQNFGILGVIIINFIYGWLLQFSNNRYGKSIIGSTFIIFILMRLFYAPRSTPFSFLSSTFTITNLIIIVGGVLIMKRFALNKIKFRIRKEQIL